MTQIERDGTKLLIRNATGRRSEAPQNVSGVTTLETDAAEK
jgi:hypothetical protein